MVYMYQMKYNPPLIFLQKYCDKIPLHRPRQFNRQERRKKKAMAKTSWYKPSDSVIFVPSTPGSALAKVYREVLEKELTSVNIKVKVVETSGQSLTRYLFKTNTSDCLIPDCPACDSNKPGASHSRSGAEYRATCLKCKEEGRLTTYEGETGSNAAYRLGQHVNDIRRITQKWALSRHLVEIHPGSSADSNAFEYQSVRTFKKP